MLVKEHEYEKFLEQKIQKGLSDLANGRYSTAEQFKQEMEQLLVHKEHELQQLEGNLNAVRLVMITQVQGKSSQDHTELCT